MPATRSDTPYTDARLRPVYSEGNQGLGEDYAEHVMDADDARALERAFRDIRDALDTVLGCAEYEAHKIAREALAACPIP